MLFTSQSFDVGFKVGDKLLYGDPGVILFVLLSSSVSVMPVIPFAALIVIADQAVAGLAVIEPVFQPKWSLRVGSR
jgi:hypothetical protein